MSKGGRLVKWKGEREAGNTATVVGNSATNMLVYDYKERRRYQNSGRVVKREGEKGNPPTLPSWQGTLISICKEKGREKWPQKGRIDFETFLKRIR